MFLKQLSLIPYDDRTASVMFYNIERKFDPQKKSKKHGTPGSEKKILKVKKPSMASILKYDNNA